MKKQQARKAAVRIKNECLFLDLIQYSELEIEKQTQWIKYKVIFKEKRTRKK